MHARKITPAGRDSRRILACLLLAGACGGEAAREQQAVSERAGIARAESTAVRVAALPSTGLWSKEAVLERLVRAGVAPREIEDAPVGPDWMRVRPVVFAAGGGEVHVWIYADSTARKAVTDSLDETTGAPAGAVPPFAAPMVFIVQNNLAAVVTGGSGTNQERVALALQAGVPAARP